MRNSLLQEEKQLLLKQLLNQPKPSPPPKPEALKQLRTTGTNTAEVASKREIGVGSIISTRDIGVFHQGEDHQSKMQTIISSLQEKINEQTILISKATARPQTRDVAIMHVVDKVEAPKPECRDVGINHRTEMDNKELIERHTLVVNTYIKEIECLKIENARLSSSLEELIRKHSKHVVTRGTHAPEPPLRFSVATNTKPVATRDVQLMFTPKSRDVSLATDRFYYTRDVGLMCTIGLVEQQEQFMELMEIKRKYEEKVQESLRQVKAMRDVAIGCNLDFKERRDVSLMCKVNAPVRDVALVCNLDNEFRSFRDVCVGCSLDKKEKCDVAINVNTFEPIVIHKQVIKEKRDFCMLAEDREKAEMAHELQVLRNTLSKSSRDASTSADHKTLVTDHMLRNQGSGVDTVRTINKQVGLTI